jgi:hypothetical protein
MTIQDKLMSYCTKDRRKLDNQRYRSTTSGVLPTRLLLETVDQLDLLEERVLKLRAELQRCVLLLDGDATMPDGSNADTMTAHELLGDFLEDAMDQLEYESLLRRTDEFLIAASAKARDPKVRRARTGAKPLLHSQRVLLARWILDETTPQEQLELQDPELCPQ